MVVHNVLIIGSKRKSKNEFFYFPVNDKVKEYKVGIQSDFIQHEHCLHRLQALKRHPCLYNSQSEPTLGFNIGNIINLTNIDKLTENHQQSTTEIDFDYGNHSKMLSVSSIEINLIFRN